jgi:hypothetical protein
LKETQELKSLALLGVDLVDTLDTHNKGQLGLGWDVERSLGFGNTTKADGFTLCVTILLDVGLGTLEDSLALLLV